MRIIIADAHPDYLSIVADFFHRHLPEATLVFVTTAEQALALYDVGGADLVITAHYLPVMTGVRLISALHVRFPELPIIMHTADESLRHAALTAGARGFVLKGSVHSLAELVVMVRQALPPSA